MWIRNGSVKFSIHMVFKKVAYSQRVPNVWSHIHRYQAIFENGPQLTLRLTTIARQERETACLIGYDVKNGARAFIARAYDAIVDAYMLVKYWTFHIWTITINQLLLEMHTICIVNISAFSLVKCDNITFSGIEIQW